LRVGVPLPEKLDVFDAGRAVAVDILHFLDLDAIALGFWRFPLPSSYSPNVSCAPAMGEPS